MKNSSTKRILITVLIVCILLIIGLSIMAGFYDAIIQTGFKPLAFLVVGYPLSVCGLIFSAIALGMSNI